MQSFISEATLSKFYDLIKNFQYDTVISCDLCEPIITQLNFKALNKIDIASDVSYFASTATVYTV